MDSGFAQGAPGGSSGVGYRSGIAMLGLLLGLATFASATFAQQPGNLALVRGTIFASPTKEPIRDGVILVQGGKITAVDTRRAVRIPQGFRTIDCSGRTIVAGFWNSHVHFFERKWTNVAAIPAQELRRQLEDMLTRYGFTSVFDIASLSENTRRLRGRIESGEVAGPRIRSTGEALLAPGAVPPDNILRVLGDLTFPQPAITSAGEASAAARKLLEAGADGIKVHLQVPPPPNPPFPESAIPAAVSEAHRSGKPVFVHPNTGADVLAAARAGVDVIAHTTPQSGPWDQTILTTMKERQVALTPTLMLWKSAARHERISLQDQWVTTAVGQLKAWASAGGTVLFGNDLGAVDYDPSEEYALMAQAGMTFGQILASLTAAPAARFGESKEAGEIRAGMRADLVVLKGDPSRNVGVLSSVQYTLRAGRTIYSAPE